MKTIRRMSLALLLSVSALFLFFSSPAAGNPSVPQIMIVDFLIIGMVLTAVNIPFNLLLYLGFAFPLMWLRAEDEPHLFEKGSLRFLGSTLTLVVMASVIGAFIDILIFMAVYRGSIYIMLLLGLAGIFLSFFILGMAFHKLGPGDAALVGLGITIGNIVFWVVIGVFTHSVLLFLAVGIIILMILIPVVFFLYEEKHRQLHFAV
ncbi:MAG: hypothetical protein AYK23_05485 [Candidatus Proteinoplasmatales archaeon SG8-5]|nr:MAG: hypothetical protein AYK23_05485 [Candidatus Proteinoplasmatales archaeon SG8-5]